MKKLFSLIAFLGIFSATIQGQEMGNIYDYTVKDIDGNTVSMEKYKGKVLLIVNVASKCGFTPQYEELQVLYDKYKAQGFEVLGFPCNQFREQEPGSEAEIKEFCTSQYSVQFPMFSKVDVNGENAHPMFVYLKGEKKGILGTKSIKWNFTKFLVNKKGEVVERFAPVTKPLSITKEIEQELSK